MPSSNAPRTRWKLGEIQSVTNAATELLMLKYKAMDMFPSADAIKKSDIMDALKQGQLCLGADRRKKHIGTYIARQLESLVRESLKSKMAAHKSDAGKPELAVIKLADPAPPAVVEQEPQPDPIQGLGEMLGASIARGFIKEVEGSPMMVDLVRLLVHRLPKAVSKPTEVPGYKRPVEVSGVFKRPRVAIIGLLADQRMAIQTKFPNIDMRFLDNRPTGDRLETVTATCDAAVMMTKFCSHIPMKKCKAKHYVPVNGGMTDLAHVLRGRYGEPTSARHPAAAAAAAA